MLPASLKDDTARMNDRNKHRVTGQVNHQTADPKANASVFLFFPTAHFLKTILASRTNGTFGFARHTSRPFAKPKEPFFTNAKNDIRTLNPNSALDKCRIDLRLVINGLQKPLKRFVHRD